MTDLNNTEIKLAQLLFLTFLKSLSWNIIYFFFLLNKPVEIGLDINVAAICCILCLFVAHCWLPSCMRQFCENSVTEYSDIACDLCQYGFWLLGQPWTDWRTRVGFRFSNFCVLGHSINLWNQELSSYHLLVGVDASKLHDWRTRGQT